MILQRQPNRWSCLLTSFSMVLEVEESTLIDKIGHDGSDILWPQLPEPHCRRSFSIHELIKVSYQFGFHVVPTAAKYFTMPDYDVEPKTFTTPKEHLDEIMRRHDGVITGWTKNKKRHAVAWNRELVFDPAGVKYSKEDFVIEVFWAITKAGGF